LKQLLLCVDDERVVLEGIRSQIKRYLPRGIQLELAESAEDALEILQEYSPHPQDFPMIITDHIMPGMKGDQLLIDIHRRFPHTIKILLTGQADAQSVGNALNQGGLYRYISKPWEEQDLMMTITGGLERFENHWEIESKTQLIEEDKEAFFRFVPEKFLTWMGEKSQYYQHLRSGVHTIVDLAVMFLDIRSFTTLCELMGHDDIFTFLEELFHGFGQEIYKQEGLIEKYMGDAILALFSSSERAVNAARAIQKQLKEINKTRNQQGKVQIKLGIGIHSGEVIIGTLGDENRLQTMVLGDCVNIAARLEELTKEHNTGILISDRVRQSLKEPESFENVGSLTLRGRFSSLKVYSDSETS
jgi:adenylate cyclase